MATLGGMVTRKRLAERRLDHEWPAEVQQLWHAAQQLRLAVDTLEAVARAKAEERGPFDELLRADGFTAAADFAASALLRVEELAAPLLREGGACDVCGDRSIGPDETRCYNCRTTLALSEGED